MLFGLKELKGDGEIRTAVTKCPSCSKVTEFPVKASEHYAYTNGGMLIQRAFKSLDASHREMLQSGMCQPCWDRTFKEELEG